MVSLSNHATFAFDVVSGGPQPGALSTGTMPVIYEAAFRRGR